MRIRFLSVLTLVTTLAACGGEEQSAGWSRIQGAPDGVHAKQLAAAQAATEAMFQSLFGRLQQAMQQGGPAEAIQVCREAAPAIAEAIAGAHGVRIGRTSFKLRNPGNTAPEWAVPYVEQRSADAVHLAHDDGRFAALLPIKLKMGCLGCHGPAEEFAPEVREALAQLYPEDRATGFAKGDLRGWFWVEVPKP